MQSMHEAYAAVACFTKNATLMLQLLRRQHHQPSMHLGSQQSTSSTTSDLRDAGQLRRLAELAAAFILSRSIQ